MPPISESRSIADTGDNSRDSLGADPTDARNPLAGRARPEDLVDPAIERLDPLIVSAQPKESAQT
jgi:hypothetical protein